LGVLETGGFSIIIKGIHRIFEIRRIFSKDLKEIRRIFKIRRIFEEPKGFSKFGKFSILVRIHRKSEGFSKSGFSIRIQKKSSGFPIII